MYTREDYLRATEKVGKAQSDPIEILEEPYGIDPELAVEVAWSYAHFAVSPRNKAKTSDREEENTMAFMMGFMVAIELVLGASRDA